MATHCVLNVMRQQRLFFNDLLISLPEAPTFQILSHVGLIFSLNSVFKTSSADMSWGLIQIKLRKLGIEHTYFMSVAQNKIWVQFSCQTRI